MTHPVFKTSLFAILEAYAPQLLAGPEGRVPFTKVHAGTGVIPMVGVLGQSEWYVDTDYSQIRQGVKRAVEDRKVQVIDLIVDSPGGSVHGLPETADAIFQAARIKPVRAQVPGMAASAAYWLASQASTVNVTPSGEVGPLGILDLHTDISKMLENAGVKLTAVHAGEHKIERAPFTALSDEAKAHMQKNVDAWYGDFLSAVRRGRGARVSPTGNYGAGRMLSAKDALSHGLVDFIGGVL